MAGSLSGKLHRRVSSAYVEPTLISPRSNTGFVNVYGSDSFAPLSSSILGSDTSNTRISPKPIKQVANLTTAISTVKFNYDAQLMAIASQERKDAMRLVSNRVLGIPFSPFGSPSFVVSCRLFVPHFSLPGNDVVHESRRHFINAFDHSSLLASPAENVKLIAIFFSFPFSGADPSPIANVLRQLADIKHSTRPCHSH